MKIAIVDIGWRKINALNPFAEAQGGSETWMLQISNEFARQGVRVDLFMNTNVSKMLVNDNLMYLNSDQFTEHTKDRHYDFVILNRFFEKDGINYVQYIKQLGITDHIYIQLHDLSFVYEDGLLETGEDMNKYGLNDDFVTIVALNDFHRKNLLLQYPSLSKDIEMIPNGIDLSLFNESNSNRDNRVLWSSCAERGLDILIEDVYPLVKKEIPDFGIDIAGYQDPDGNYAHNGYDIRYLGKLNKRQLYREQQKHKVWFYPGTFAETFCITLLENIMNGCQVVSPLTYGTAPTLGEYADDLRMTHQFDRNNKEEYNAACREAADKIVGILKTNGRQPEIYDDIKEKIHNEYNWTYSVNKYIEHLKMQDIKPETTERAKYKAVFMSMFCNKQFFIDEEKVVEQTWAEDLINGLYPGYKFYAYTSCDEQHPNECIDGNIIYVDVPDDIYHTFSKTRRAYRMLQEHGETFEFFFHTNTSTYINVPNTIQMIDKCTQNTLCSDWAGYYLKNNSTGKYEFAYNIPSGFGYLLSQSIGDKIFYSGLDETSFDMPDGDDIFVAKILYKLGIKYDIKDFHTELPCLLGYRYKPFDEADRERFVKNLIPEIDTLSERITDDPQKILANCFMQVRSMYVDLDERMSKGKEFEHMRELHKVFKDNQANKHFKILFLSMSCNDPFFKLSRQSVHTTWAKDLIDNHFGEQYGFLSYTSCDEEHPHECIDDNTVYVDVPDDLDHTYSKTVRCINYLYSLGYTFDWLVRTNTSTFVNVRKFIEEEPNWNKTDVLSMFVYPLYDEKVNFVGHCTSGWGYVISSQLLNRILFDRLDETHLGYVEKMLKISIFNKFDDTIMGCQVAHYKQYYKEKYNIDINLVNIPVRHYKCIPNTNVLRLPDVQPDDANLDLPDERITNPEDAKNEFFVQVRNWGIEGTRYLEIEHMQELYDTIEKHGDMRPDIINWIIKKNNYKSYLEIGLDNAWNFKQICCENKTSVDPFGDDNITVLTPEIAKYLTHRMTSDEFFEQNSETFDIIFIDGMHTKEQVAKDISNSLKRLNENGIILVHDCLPKREECQLVPRICGEWNGDVWKVLPELSLQHIDYQVINTDCGIGVIVKQNKTFNPVISKDYDYKDVFANRYIRDGILNVISLNDFYEKISLRR